MRIITAILGIVALLFGIYYLFASVFPADGFDEGRTAGAAIATAFFVFTLLVIDEWLLDHPDARIELLSEHHAVAVLPEGTDSIVDENADWE